MSLTQAEKAIQFSEQHLAKKLLVLPNVWDVLSAKVVAALGYGSIATASASIALSNGYRDGEFMPFTRLLHIVAEITNAVDLPVSVDVERGFAGNISDLKENIRQLIEAGAIGLNIEDGLGEGNGLLPVNEQCRKIEAVREVGEKYGVPIFINARTDVFIKPSVGNPIEDAITRARAYKAAGANCFFPIMVNNYEDLTVLLKSVEMPVNVFLLKSVSDLKKLESIGVARVSVGPMFLQLALAKMKKAAEGLLDYKTEEFFLNDTLPTDFIDKLLYFHKEE